MTLTRLLKSAGIGIAVALMVLVIGVAGQMAWLALGLPDVHWTAVAPRPTPERAPQNLSVIDTTTLSDRSETISDSYADVSLLPSLILAILGWLSASCGRSGGTVIQPESRSVSPSDRRTASMTGPDWISCLTRAIEKSQEPWRIVATVRTPDGGLRTTLVNERSGRTWEMGVSVAPFDDEESQRLLTEGMASSLASR